MADHPLRPAKDRRLGGPLPHQLANPTRAHPSTIEENKEKGIGNVIIFANNKESIEAAKNRIKAIVAVPEVGEIYESEVKSIMPYGAFVEFMPGKQGLLHISEVSHKRLENLDGILKEGDKIEVKLLGIDNKTGKYKLSRKVLLPKEG